MMYDLSATRIEIYYFFKEPLDFYDLIGKSVICERESELWSLECDLICLNRSLSIREYILLLGLLEES